MAKIDMEESLDDELTSLLTSAQIDYTAVQRAIADLLAAVGEDPNRQGLQDTPERVARMYSELLQG
jgi:GTP cyclohydrolase I